MIYFLIFLIGASVGSFLNVVIDRLPAGQSIITPPSHCPACQQRLKPPDLVPIFSYICLRGHCRYCGAHIPLRLPLVEAGTGLIFLLLCLNYGLDIQWAIVAFYSAILITLAVIDLEQGILPNKLVYPALPVALALSLIYLPMQGMGMFVHNTTLAALLSSLLGGAVIFLVLLITCLASRGGIGWGDVKMAGLIGFMTGFPLSLVAMGIALVSGGLAALILLLLKRKGRKEAMSFGPFLSLGAFVTLIWGQSILAWYLGFF